MVHRPSRVAAVLCGLIFVAPSAHASSWQMLGALPTYPDNCRAEHVAVYDSDQVRMLVFGGWFISYSGFDTEVWSLSLAGGPTWSQLATVGQSPPAAGYAAYDPVGRRMLVLSNAQSVWQLTLEGTPTWSPLAVTGTPPSSFGWGAFDAARRRLLLVRDGAVWALSLDPAPAWSQLSPSGSFSLAPDAVIVRGDHLWVADEAAVWKFDLVGPPTWTQVSTTGTPPAPDYARSAVYDPAADRIVFFGAFGGGFGYPHGVPAPWELSLAAGAEWKPLEFEGPSAPGRYSAQAIFDQHNRRIVISCGASRNGGLDELTWSDAWALPSQGALDVPGASPSRSFALACRGPNPTAGVVRLSLEVERVGPVQVEVFSTTGARIRTLESRAFEPGVHRLEWDGRNDAGDRAAPGVYLIRAAAPGARSMVKVALF